MQVAINDATRSIVGCKRRDHIHIGDLLERAGLPSLNEWPQRQWPWRPGNTSTPTTVAAVPGTRCWLCLPITDGPRGTALPVSVAWSWQ
ncbi:Hypothetical protein FKW44_002295, partial [Caligus rogercresseyi]